MLLTKEVEVIPSGKMIQYYKDKGYDAKFKQPLIIAVHDLSDKSSHLIHVKCDYCGKEKEIRYVDYMQSISINNKYACTNCAHIKASETIYETYGVLNYSSTKECREKVKNTLQTRYGISHPSESEEFLKRKMNNNKQKYGVEHTLQVAEFREKGYETNYQKYGTKIASQNAEIQQKIKETINERYDCDFASQNEDIKNKIRLTNQKKYGYDCALQVPEIKEKISKTIKEKYGIDNISQSEDVKNQKCHTTYEHYGVYHPLQSPEILAKAHETMYKNGTCPTSRQQQYIFDLYSQSNPSAELNYPVSHYSADICFPEEKLVVEVDFGGHDLAVKTGKITQEEFNQKEIIRNNIFKREGYKTMHITSITDKLPSDTTLLQLLSYARQYFSEYPNHSWINFSIDTSQVFNAENKEGIFFNYGELHRLKQSA